VGRVASFAVGAAVVVATFGAATPAVAAGPGGQVPPTGPVGGGSEVGAQATYQVRVSGDIIGGSSSVLVGAPQTCWWGLANQGGDAQQFSQWYDGFAVANRAFGSEVWYGMPHPGQVSDAVQDQQAGNAGRWYSYRCRPGVTLDEAFRSQYGMGSYETNPTFPVWYRWVRNGQPVPAGFVSPQDLLEIAMRYIRLLPPKIGRSPGGDAITQLATWLWVGADDAKIKRVRAEAGPVWVEVSAPSQGITFSSPYAGSVSCPPGEATTVYTPGATDSSCTLTWVRASWDGPYPLTVSNSWYATYTGSDGSGGPVPNQPAPQVSTEQVRLVETQVVGNGQRWSMQPS
jgi:hypothetical protein